MDERHPEILPVMAMKVKLKIPGDTDMRTAEIDMMVQEEETRRSLPKWLSDKVTKLTTRHMSRGHEPLTYNIHSHYNITVIRYTDVARYLDIFQLVAQS
jgi:hypothetical protein